MGKFDLVFTKVQLCIKMSRELTEKVRVNLVSELSGWDCTKENVLKLKSKKGNGVACFEGDIPLCRKGELCKFRMKGIASRDEALAIFCDQENSWLFGKVFTGKARTCFSYDHIRKVFWFVKYDDYSVLRCGTFLENMLIVPPDD